MLLFERILVLIALGIAVFMLAPPTSPVIGSGTLLSSSSSSSETVERTVALPTPLPPQASPKPRPKPTEAKAILMTGYVAGGKRFETLFDLIQRTELNAVVIDIKDESGEVSWVPRDPALRAFGAGRTKIKDPEALIQKLKRAGVYVIGRIVTMQDPIVSETRPDLAVRDIRGGTWKTEKGLGWVDPYAPEVWDYAHGLAREAVSIGFDEIQFDYIRFPSDGDISRIWYPHRDHRHPSMVIRGFFAEARRQLVPLGAYISVDLFGLVTLAEDDMGIGQRLQLIAQEVDYLSLMLYPSHYTRGNYGIPDPEADPYQTILLSIRDAKRKTKGTGAKLRPWIQDFSLRVRYTPDLVRAQIKALEDEGVYEYLLWNAANRYTEDALRPAGARPRN